MAKFDGDVRFVAGRHLGAWPKRYLRDSLPLQKMMSLAERATAQNIKRYILDAPPVHRLFWYIEHTNGHCSSDLHAI